jgi:hypothetical protein
MVSIDAPRSTMAHGFDDGKQDAQTGAKLLILGNTVQTGLGLTAPAL